MDTKYEFKPKSKWREKLGEKFIAINAFSALIGITLIFIFIFKESIPIFTSAEVHEEVTIKKMVAPQIWKEGQKPKYTWQPNSNVPKYSLLPLFVGTLKAALVAMLFAAPLGIGAAIYSSEFASKRMREIIKPVIELLAGIPSVVLGFFALIILATILQTLFGLTYRLNALNAGIALGIAIVPIIFTVAEDAMNSVPGSLRDAARALGANPWQVSFTMVLPAAMPGIAAGMVLGFGRAIGETMAVMMVTGNAARMPLSPDALFLPVRTMTATIAAEMGEVAQGSTHFHVLFAIGIVLFVITFIVNFIASIAIFRQSKRSARLLS